MVDKRWEFSSASNLLKHFCSCFNTVTIQKAQTGYGIKDWYDQLLLHSLTKSTHCALQADSMHCHYETICEGEGRGGGEKGEEIIFAWTRWLEQLIIVFHFR